jgi:transcriptional regulator with XRE-family HTH domain
MSIETTAMTLRAKIIGALIRDARLAAEKTIDECAGIVGVPEQDFEAYELGSRAISLPELEAIAYHLQVSLDHFWERETLVAKYARADPHTPPYGWRHVAPGASGGADFTSRAG